MNETLDEIVDRLKTVNSYPIDPDTLGRAVRGVWMRWARRQPDCKQDWVAPWEELPERIREVDVMIGREIELLVRLHVAALLGSPTNDKPAQS